MVFPDKSNKYSEKRVHKKYHTLYGSPVLLFSSTNLESQFLPQRPWWFPTKRDQKINKSTLARGSQQGDSGGCGWTEYGGDCSRGMRTWLTALEAEEENQCLQGSLTISNRVGTAMPAMSRSTLNHGCRFNFSKKPIVFKRKINYILKLLNF